MAATHLKENAAEFKETLKNMMLMGKHNGTRYGQAATEADRDDRCNITVRMMEFMMIHCMMEMLTADESCA